MASAIKRKERLLASLLAVDRKLKAKGFHGLSDAFRDCFVRFVASGRQTLVLRKGRRGGGTSSCVEFIASYLQTDIPVSRGDVGTFVVLSHTLAASRDVLRRLHETLDALGVAHTATADKLAFEGCPLEVRCFAANFTAVRGTTVIGALVDECAFIRNDAGDSPVAAIVEQALAPAMATIAGAPMLLVSSPQAHDDYHALRYSVGDSESPSQMVACIPTWVGNPALTEDACRALAASHIDFLREFAAIPQDSIVTTPFLPELITALERSDPGRPVGRRVVATDPSSGANDSWVWLVAGWNLRADGTPVLTVNLADGAFGAWARVKSADDVFDALAGDAKKLGATDVFADQRDLNHTASGCRRHGLKLSVMKHTTESKAVAVRRLQLFLESGQLALPQRNRERIKQSLRNYRQSETRTGQVRFGGKGKRSDDFVAALLTLMMADEAGLLEGGVNAKRTHRDPPPFAGSPLVSVQMVHGPQRQSSGVLDDIRIGSDTRAHFGNNGGSQFRNKGGF